MSEKCIKNPPGSDSTFVPSLINNRPIPYSKFTGKFYD